MDIYVTCKEELGISSGINRRFFRTQKESLSLVSKEVSWLLGWHYRKGHVIEHATGAGTNYPIKIKTHYGSGTDSGGEVYLNSHCRSDFGDVRFTREDGTTLLDYWMEQKVDSDYAVFWVKIPDDLSTNDVKIYIYYDKSDATSISDALNLDLFQLREYDFYTSYDPDFRFSKSDSSVLRIDSYTGGGGSLGRGYAFIHAKKGYLNGKKLKICWRVYFSYSSIQTLAYLHVVNNPHLRTKTTDEFKDNDGTEHPLADYTELQLLSKQNAGVGWSPWSEDTSAVIDLSSFTSDFVTILIRTVDGWAAQTVMAEIDYLQILDSEDNVLKTFHFTESVAMERTGTLRDYGLYRKYVSPEPEHGRWEAEEEITFGIKIWKTDALFKALGKKETLNVDVRFGPSGLWLYEYINLVINAVQDWNATNWVLAWRGMVLSKLNYSHFDTIIDNYKNASNWDGVIMTKNLAERVGYSSTTIDNAVKAALDGVQMFTNYKLPKNYRYNNKDWFLTQVPCYIDAYRWAKELNYQKDKWDPVSGYNGLHYVLQRVGDGFWAGNPDTGEGEKLLSGRWHEKQTVAACMWKFWRDHQIEGAKNDIVTLWGYMNSRHWTVDHYSYAVSLANYEFSQAGMFNVFGLYHTKIAELSNYKRCTIHVHNAHLKDYWESPLFRCGDVIYHWAVHHNPENSQRRMEAMLGTIITIHQAWPYLNSEGKTLLRNMLIGIGTTPGWKVALEGSRHGMYNATTYRFRMASDSDFSDVGTANGAVLLFLLGISPSPNSPSGSLAIPLDYSWFNDYYQMNPEYWRWDGENHKIRIPVFHGKLVFMYGPENVEYFFQEDGVYEVTFNSSYSSITQVTRIGDLTGDYLCPGKQFNINAWFKTFGIEKSFSVIARFGEPPPGWLLGWIYRKNIAISKASGAGTNYQVLLKIGESSGATGVHFHVENHCYNFPEDIRFTDNDGKTLLSYWIEEVTGESPNRIAKVWVKVADDLYKDRSIYCYYRKKEESSASNGDDTFIFFDHFLGTSLDTNKWNVIQGDVTVANSELKLTGGETTRGVIESKTNFPINAAVHQRARWSYTVVPGACVIGMRKAGTWDESAGRAVGTSYACQVNFSTTSGGNTTTTAVAKNYPERKFLYRVKWIPNKSTFEWVDGEEKQAIHTTNIPTENQVLIYVEGTEARDVYIDWVFVRKYVDPEPAFSSAGPEETVVIYKGCFDELTLESKPKKNIFAKKVQDLALLDLVTPLLPKIFQTLKGYLNLVDLVRPIPNVLFWTLKEYLPLFDLQQKLSSRILAELSSLVCFCYRSGWLEGWTYRKRITIAGSSGAGIGYQVLLKIGESSGSSGVHFHLENHAKNFPHDIRFTDKHGGKLLNYWIQAVTGESPNRVARFWVKVEDNLDSNVDIYCYYGKEGAVSISNGEGTFLFFDSFRDLSKWQILSGTWDIKSGVLRALGGVNTIIRTKTYKTPSNYAFDCRIKPETGYEALQAEAQVFGLIDANNFFTSYPGVYYGNAKRNYWDHWKKTKGSWSNLKRVMNIYLDGWVWQNISVRVTGTSFKTFKEDTEVASLSDSSLTPGYIGLLNLYEICYYDDVRVRKYVDPEPAFSSAANEEGRHFVTCTDQLQIFRSELVREVLRTFLVSLSLTGFMTKKSEKRISAILQLLDKSLPAKYFLYQEVLYLREWVFQKRAHILQEVFYFAEKIARRSSKPLVEMISYLDRCFAAFLVIYRHKAFLTLGLNYVKTLYKKFKAYLKQEVKAE